MWRRIRIRYISRCNVPIFQKMIKLRYNMYFTYIHPDTSIMICRIITYDKNYHCSISAMNNKHQLTAGYTIQYIFYINVLYVSCRCFCRKFISLVLCPNKKPDVFVPIYFKRGPHVDPCYLIAVESAATVTIHTQQDKIQINIYRNFKKFICVDEYKKSVCWIIPDPKK